MFVASPDDPWGLFEKETLGDQKWNSDMRNVLREWSAMLVGISNSWSAFYSQVGHFMVTSLLVLLHPPAHPTPPPWNL